MVAWIVSNCITSSRREDYVRKLKEHVSIDIFGGCTGFGAKRFCSYEDKKAECYNAFRSEYRFYLSFENSVCKDYVTEKFYQVSLSSTREAIVPYLPKIPHFQSSIKAS
jgi:hypothetical protein